MRSLWKEQAALTGNDFSGMVVGHFLPSDKVLLPALPPFPGPLLYTEPIAWGLATNRGPLGSAEEASAPEPCRLAGSREGHTEGDPAGGG